MLLENVPVKKTMKAQSFYERMTLLAIITKNRKPKQGLVHRSCIVDRNVKDFIYVPPTTTFSKFNKYKP